MKKTITMFLALLCSALAVSATACGSDNSTSNFDENHEHVWVDATCTVPQTCSVCGATTGTTIAHTGTVTCTSCGIDYFDEVESLIIKYGKYDSTNSMFTYSYQGKTYVSDGDTFKSCVAYSPSNNCIYIIGYEYDNSDLYSFSTFIAIPNSSKGTSMEESKYVWRFDELTTGTMSMLGIMTAQNFKSYNSTLTASAATGFKSTSDQSLACTVAAGLCAIGLQNAFAPLLEMGENGIKPANFGFIYF